jgi:hypothetical protein
LGLEFTAKLILPTIGWYERATDGWLCGDRFAHHELDALVKTGIFEELPVPAAPQVAEPAAA